MVRRQAGILRKSAGERVFDALNIAFMLALSFLCLYPFVYVLALSLNDGVDAQRGGIYFWPRVFSFENYTAVFKDSTIVSAYGITLFRVVAGTLLSLALTSAAAFALTRPLLPFKKFFNWVVILPMYFTGGLIPYYLVINSLGLRDNILMYVIPMLYAPFHLILMRTFIRQLPEALCESGKLDGANEFVLFTRVVFPLLGPVLATVSLFVAVGHWNDWFTGTLYMSKKSLWPASTLLLNILRTSEISNFVNPKFFAQGALARKRVVTPESLKMAMLIVTTVPIVAVYPFLQKYFVKGVMVGSLKG